MRKLLNKNEVKRFVREYPRALNESFLKLLEAYRTDNVESLISNEDPSQQTQQKSSMLSPLNEQVLKYISPIVSSKWKYQGGLGYDSMWGRIPLEHKFSSNTSNSWTGHPYSNKTDYHLLMKADISGNQIKGLFVGIINLEECSEFTQWPKTVYETASYSSLKIHNSDIEKMQLIFGNLVPCRKWAKVILEGINNDF